MLVRLATDVGEAEFWKVLLGTPAGVVRLQIPEKYYPIDGYISYARAKKLERLKDTSMLTYGNLFKKCVEDSVILLGLYRPENTKDSRMPYMHSVPDKTEVSGS